MWIRIRIRIRNTAWRYRLPPPRCSRQTCPRIQNPPPAESPVTGVGRWPPKKVLILKGIVPRDGFGFCCVTCMVSFRPK
jgi:hypothetical protein